jgi:hypothetical protein
MERIFSICPNCGVNSPVLSQKQISAFASLWSFSVMGPVVGIWLRFSNMTKGSDLAAGLLRAISVIALVVGGICLIAAVVSTVLRKKQLNAAKLKRQAEHPAA